MVFGNGTFQQVPEGLREVIACETNRINPESGKLYCVYISFLILRFLIPTQCFVLLFLNYTCSSMIEMLLKNKMKLKLVLSSSADWL